MGGSQSSARGRRAAPAEDTSWLTSFLAGNLPPSPFVVIEGENVIRAGNTFCVTVNGHEEDLMNTNRLTLDDGMTLLRTETEVVGGKVAGWPTIYQRSHIRATSAGELRVVVRNDYGEVSGSPVTVTVQPGPLNIESSSYAPCSGEVPAVGHICHVSSAVEYEFFPRDEFGNAIPCDDALASHFSVKCSSDLMIMDTEVLNGKLKLFFRPLEEGQVDVVLEYDGQPVFPNPVTVLTVPQTLAVAVRENRLEANGIKCSMVSHCVDEIGAQEQDDSKKTVYIYVTPSKVTVKHFFLGLVPSVDMCWPLNRSLSVTVVDIPEDRRYPVTKQRGYLDIKEVGVGRMRLLMPKIDALKVSAITKQTLNDRYVGGALEKRTSVLFSRIRQRARSFRVMNFNIRRENIISEAWNQFSGFMKEEGHLLANTHVTFLGEYGQDCGGLSKEFMTTLQQQLFDPEAGLWAPASSAIKLQPRSEPAASASAAADSDDDAGAAIAADAELFAPLIPRADPSPALSRRTGVSVENLYKLCGIIVARTLAGCVSYVGGSQLPFRLASSVFKHVLSLQVSSRDLEHDDPSFYKSTVRQILDNEVEYLDLNFCEDVFTLDNKYIRSVCLDPASPSYYARATKAGKTPPSVKAEETLAVTDANKAIYVEELAKYRLSGAMLPYLDAFREGFLCTINDEDASLLTPDELVMVTCASAKISPRDMRQHTEVVNSKPQLIDWLWEAIETFCETERRMFLLFVTGSMCPPQGGFAKLHPPLKIVCLTIGSHNDLPRAHTCFNELDLPPYQSYSELFSKLLMAINEGVGYNGMA